MLRFATRMACFLFLLFGGFASVLAGDMEGVGFRKLDAIDPVSARPMDVFLFYPSPMASRLTILGPYDLDAVRDADIKAGRHPVILISHGAMGSLWGHHDLASFLARKGYIAIVLSHPGDNFKDQSGIGATSTIYGRPLQISAALTAALQTPFLEQHIDERRIGFVGFSAGGTTGLILAGGAPEMQRLETYCASRPHDRHVCEAGGQIRNDRPELAPNADPRIRAFVLMAPLSVVFPADSLKNIHVPMMIYVGEKDEELSFDQNSMALAQALPARPMVKVISGAGHFIFLAPCSERLAFPALCKDAIGVDRVSVHQKINAEIANFFGEAFDALRQ